ncbi:hypothetical protein PspKH34_25220 [Parageobacillus sp. KH3-4]|nr:hypothetical protein PspKH34_25220 [Parageobacillus sp. KH3-4]
MKKAGQKLKTVIDLGAVTNGLREKGLCTVGTDFSAGPYFTFFFVVMSFYGNSEFIIF